MELQVKHKNLANRITTFTVSASIYRFLFARHIHKCAKIVHANKHRGNFSGAFDIETVISAEALEFGESTNWCGYAGRTHNKKWHRCCSSIGMNSLLKACRFETFGSCRCRCTARRYKYVRAIASRCALKSELTNRALRIRMGSLQAEKTLFIFITIVIGWYGRPLPRSKSMCAVEFSA